MALKAPSNPSHSVVKEEIGVIAKPFEFEYSTLAQDK